MSTMLNLYEAKTHLSKWIDEVERTGRRLVICRHRKPVVDLVPHRVAPDPLAPDAALRGAEFLGDPAAPLDEHDWPGAAR